MYMLYFEIIVRVMSCRLRLDAGYAVVNSAQVNSRPCTTSYIADFLTCASHV